MRPMPARAAPLALTALLLAGCVGGDPHRPSDRQPGREPFGAPVELADPDRPGGDREARDRDDPIVAALPRSGDPARPNVKVEVQVTDVASSDGLRLRAGVRGSLVRGVVNLRLVARGAAGSTRSRSQTSAFVVVQSGSVGSLWLSGDARRLAGVEGLSVAVEWADAASGEAEVAIAPYAAGTAVRGETIAGSTRVRVRRGEAVVIGGLSQRDARERRGTGRFDERRTRRDLLVLLVVDVLG